MQPFIELRQTHVVEHRSSGTSCKPPSSMPDVSSQKGFVEEGFCEERNGGAVTFNSEDEREATVDHLSGQGLRNRRT